MLSKKVHVLVFYPLLSYHVWTQSLFVQHAVAIICLTMYGALYEHIHILRKVKGNIHPTTGHEGPEGE